MAEEINHDVETSGDESGLIKALRLQIKDQEKELRARPVREDLEAEIRSKLARESAAAALLTEQGHPARLAGFMLNEIGDAEITTETVVGFLEGLGYETKPASDGEQQPAPAQQLAEVASLASRVSTAASNAPAGDLAARIANAQSNEELKRIMEEAGSVQSLY